jgi:hypothetical protein
MNEQFDVVAVDCCVLNVQARLIDRTVKIKNDTHSSYYLIQIQRKHIVTLSVKKGVRWLLLHPTNWVNQQTHPGMGTQIQLKPQNASKQLKFAFLCCSIKNPAPKSIFGIRLRFSANGKSNLTVISFRSFFCSVHRLTQYLMLK